MTRRRLRVILFGTGGVVSAACLQAVTSDHDVIGVVRAARGGRARYLAGRLARQFRLLDPDPLADASRELGVPQWPIATLQDAGLWKRLEARRPDVLCVAHFPWRLPQGLLATATHGGFNVHASLLPRHRGPLPLFWVYHADDRETGVTVHQLSEDFDRGDVIAQEAFALPRGYPVDELNAANARVGAALLRQALGTLAEGNLVRRPQDDRQATNAPRVARGQAMVDYEGWDAERVWHFLAGVWPRFVEPLTDAEGRAIGYAGVTGYEQGPPVGRTGRVRRDRDGRLVLDCRDGIVILRDRLDRDGRAGEATGGSMHGGA